MSTQEFTLENLQSVLKTHLETIQLEKGKLEETNNVLNSKVNRLQCELDTANKTIGKQDEKCKALKEELDLQIKQYAITTDELNKIKYKLTCTEKELSNLQNIISSTSGEVKGKLSNEKLLVHLGDVIRENDNLIKKKNVIIANNEAVIEELRQEIERWKSKYEELLSKVPKEKRIFDSIVQTEQTGDDLLNANKIIEEKEGRLSQQLELLSDNEARIKKLKEENQALKKHYQAVVSKSDTTQVEKRLAEVQEHLNALKTALHQMKDSKEIESKQLQEDFAISMENLQKTQYEIDTKLSKRNKNLEDIIDTLNKSLSQSSTNISEIQEQLLKTGEYHTPIIDISQSERPQTLSVKKTEDVISTRYSEELYLIYVDSKKPYTSETRMAAPPSVKSVMFHKELTHTSKDDLKKNTTKDNIKVITTLPSHDDPELLKLKHENELLKSEIKKCTCQKTVSPLTKQTKQNKNLPIVADLNKQVLNLFDNINLILNSLNDLEKSILALHQNISKFCTCNELSNESKSIFTNIEQKISEANTMIFDFENNFMELENNSLPILKNIKEDENILTIEQLTDFVQLQSSLLLISELFIEIDLRMNCVTKDFELVKHECEELMKITNKSYQLTKPNYRKNVFQYLPRNVKIYYPKDRKESNTFLMYVPDETCKCNPKAMGVTQTSSNLQQMQVIQISVESESKMLDETRIGDSPSKGWLTKKELDDKTSQEPINLKIWRDKHPLVLCNRCGKKDLKNIFEIPTSFKEGNTSLQNQVSKNTTTSKIKLDDAQTS